MGYFTHIFTFCIIQGEYKSRIFKARGDRNQDFLAVYHRQLALHICMYVCMYVCIYRVQNVFLRCPIPRLHCFLSSHWPSFRFLSFMVFFIPSIQFFYGLPRVLFCFGIHFNAILGSLSSAIL